MQFKCHRGIHDVVPFQDLGFLTTVQFTHEIHPAPADELWRKFSQKKRQVILKATGKMSVSTLDDPAVFMRFCEANLSARGIKNKRNVPTCCRVIEACLARNRGRILAAFDQEKNLAAAIFYVWDNAASYYMMTTQMLTSDSGTVSALIWQAMQDAAQRQLIFDFAGLHAASSVLFFAAFGGGVSPRQHYLSAWEESFVRL